MEIFGTYFYPLNLQKSGPEISTNTGELVQPQRGRK
jgi:hypothetical protein